MSAYTDKSVGSVCEWEKASPAAGNSGVGGLGSPSGATAIVAAHLAFLAV